MSKCVCCGEGADRARKGLCALCTHYECSRSGSALCRRQDNRPDDEGSSSHRERSNPEKRRSASFKQDLADRRAMSKGKPKAVLTFGYLPSEFDFAFHWDAYVGEGDFMIVEKGMRQQIAAGKHSESEVYYALGSLLVTWRFKGSISDEAADTARAVLKLLGFEWVR